MLFVLQKNFVFFACLFVSVLALLDRVYDLLNFAVDQHTRGILVLLCAVARRVVDVAGRKDELVLLLEMLRVFRRRVAIKTGDARLLVLVGKH
jgi:hypothetical protein